MTPRQAQIKTIYNRPYHPPVDITGWGFESTVFPKLIAEVKPESIIEIGTYKGASAIRMAKLCQSIGLDTVIYAVDFFQDAILQTKEDPIPVYPGVGAYDQFLANVWHSGVTDCIIPVRTWSPNAPEYFKAWGVTADLIYVDGGHEADIAYQDISLYWEILRSGGVMFGHDWPMQGVKDAVHKWCHVIASDYHAADLEIDGDHWILRKP